MSPVAKTNDHQMLRRQNDDALAEGAGCKERVAGNAEPHAPLGVFVRATIGPEPGAIISVERGSAGKVYPALGQKARSADHAVIEIK